MSIEDINKFIYYLKNSRNEKGQAMFDAIDIVAQSPDQLPQRPQTIYRFELLAFLLGEED